ncbi:MAG: DinB family protein [Acidobacteriota bacterium]
MTVDEARFHIRYSGWASAKLMDAARALSPEDLTRPTGISHESIGGTLSHIHFADRIWYARLVDPAEPVHKEVDFPTLETLWPRIQQKWETWTQSISQADLNRVIGYRNSESKSHSSQVSQVVLHVVNHATLHRGQVVGMIRQLGIRPPATDFLFYTRELAAAQVV